MLEFALTNVMQYIGSIVFICGVFGVLVSILFLSGLMRSLKS